MVIHSPYLDVLYEAQPNTKTIDVTVGDYSEKFAPLHGGIRMLCITLPDSLVGGDHEVHIRCDGDMQVGKIASRMQKHEVLGIPEDKPAKSACLASASELPLSIQWFVTWRCNYNCHYCWQETTRDSYRKERPADRTPTEWADALLRLLPDEVYLSGGEPTTLRGITDIVSLIGSQVPINMTSNLGKSFDLDVWKREVSPEAIDCVTFSFHPTQQSWEDYSSKLRRFVSIYGGQKAGAELVMHPNQTEHEQPIRDLADELGLRTINIDIYHRQPVIYPARPGDAADRCPNQNPEIARLPRHAPADTSPHYCSAGINRLNIDPIGNAYTCMSAIDRSKMFGKHSLPHYKPVGNVFDPWFRMQQEPVLCWETFRCSGCDADKIKQTWVEHPYPHELPLPQ